MWGPIWGNVPDDQRPVRAITNGIHVPTWLSAELSRLFDDHLGGDWRERHDDPTVWDRVLEIPDEELWAVRNALRNYLFAFIRERARSRWKEEHVTAARVVAAGTLLDPNALTIGFARRFTGYKRPELIFHNPDRLISILTAARRPVQIVFAGKAHPADEMGKHHLQQVYRRAIDPMFGGRIAFVDDYDLHVAHFLVQGCDIWLNTPRKPLEASGTSGMKASINGVPHMSIGDGWWAEGYNGRNGWLIEGKPQNQDAERSIGRMPKRFTSCWNRKSSRRSTTAIPTASRAAGWRSCARQSGRSLPGSARGAWSSSTPRRCTVRRCSSRRQKSGSSHALATRARAQLARSTSSAEP